MLFTEKLLPLDLPFAKDVRLAFRMYGPLEIVPVTFLPLRPLASGVDPFGRAA